MLVVGLLYEWNHSLHFAAHHMHLLLHVNLAVEKRGFVVQRDTQSTNYNPLLDDMLISVERVRRIRANMTVEKPDDKTAEKVIAALERNPLLRTRLLQVIEPGEYVKRDELAEVLKEIRVLREDQAKRFEAMDKRFEAMQKHSDERFEAMQKQLDDRFEAMDKRFEAMQKQIDKRFEAMQKQLDDRFEAMDKRFEAMQKQIDKRFEAVDKRFETMDKRFEAMIQGLQKGFDTVRRDVATMSTRYGLRLEDIFREVFREALLTEGVDPEKIRRLDVLDDEGVVVPPGEVTDIDMMGSDSQCVFVEVKAHMDMHDIWRFLKVVRLAEEQEKVKASKLIAVTLDISPKDKVKAERMGVKVITSEA